MTHPSRIPRKYLSVLSDSQSTLKGIAIRAHNMANELQRKGDAWTGTVITQLRDIEAEAYRVALDLTDIEVASGCHNCPAAPIVTESDLRLGLLSERLQQLVDFARSAALSESESNEKQP